MKRFLTLLFFLMIILNSAYAENDITFQNIPWLSDETMTYQKLSNANLILGQDVNLKFSKENVAYIYKDETGFISPDQITTFSDVCYSLDLSNRVKGKIAGHPLKNIVLTFAYDGSYKLIAVRIELVMAEYNELTEKLSQLYGIGDKNTTDEGVETIVWYGAEQSLVMLYTQNNGYNFTLMYGRLDAVEILQNCLAPADPDDVSGL